jgi:hypothetical protein
MASIGRERYNPDSEFGNWLPEHREALPEILPLFQSKALRYRGVACYVLANMLAKAKTKEPFPSSEYLSYKQRIRWHILHDTPGVLTGFAIEGWH